MVESLNSRLNEQADALLSLEDAQMSLELERTATRKLTKVS